MSLTLAQHTPGTGEVLLARKVALGLKPLVDSQVTSERILRYLDAICSVSAPSSVASLCRSPILEKLWREDRLFEADVQFDPDALGTGNAVLNIGTGRRAPLWYVAHLDTISYLVQPEVEGRHHLVPFCVHLTENGERDAEVLRYDLDSARLKVCGEGRLVSRDGQASYVKTHGDTPGPGDRVVPVAPFHAAVDGLVTGHLDNGGGVAALAVAALVLAKAKVDAMLVFPDEEEGPVAIGNQSMSRGMARLASRLDPPDLAIVVDSQQAMPMTTAFGTVGRLGSGAVLSEFSSLARGSVTPPPLYTATRAFFRSLGDDHARVGELPNSYTSRSDDVSLMLRTRHILLLGYPGSDRHFDRTLPTAQLSDIVELTKSLVYASALRAIFGDLSDG